MKTTRFRGALAAGMLLLIFAVPAMGADPSAQELLDRLVAKNAGAGGGVFRISDGGGNVREHASGLTGGPGSAPMSPETPFEIASITKAVVAAAILRLVEEGKLRPDSRIGEILPPAQAAGFDPAITVRQLLSHTSGLADYWDDRRGFLRAFVADPGRHWEPGEILAYARRLTARRPPARFRYSDTNYVLLGLALEHLERAPLHRVLRERVFAPLGMRDTWMSYREDRRGGVPSHRFEGREDLSDTPRQSADWAGGGLVSTARDLEKFLTGLAGGRLFKSPGTLATMLDAVPTGDEGISYGLGLYRVDLGGGRGEVWGHDGHGNSFAYYWPQRRTFFTGTLNQTHTDWWPLVAAPTGTAGGVENEKPLNAQLAVGWDSLYMFRGVNANRGGGRYGSGIAWAAVSAGWDLTADDSLGFEVWHCLGMQRDAYKEIDFSLAYTRMLGDLSVTCGYAFYCGYAPQDLFSHELSAVAAREFSLGPATVTPSLGYFFNIGPDTADGKGMAAAGSGFLAFRVDASLPVWREVVALEPWGAFGVNFSYNSRTGPDDEPVAFNGCNNLEFGVAVPVRLTRSITVSAYAAYSRALAGLVETDPDTFWTGASVTVSF
jgi:D-alanyl-D-alanine carboxypeptidase